MRQVTLAFNPVFKKVNTTRKRYRVLRGGAGSGKSFNIAQDFVLKLSDMQFKGANLVCVRKIDESNRQSTYSELLAAIKRIFGPQQYKNYWHVTVNPLGMKCLITGNQVLFRGMRDENQREKVKSITVPEGKITWIWVEEATELTESDFDILDDRLRGRLDNPNLFYQITATFNPVSSTHWLKAKFFDVPDEDVLAHHSTYKDNLFIDDGYHKRMERSKETNYEHYRVYALGEWGLLGGQFFGAWNEKLHTAKPFSIPEHWPRFRCMDWGSSHPYACYWVAADFDGNLWVYRELYGYGGKANVGTRETTRQVAKRIAELEKDDKNLMSYAVLDNACWTKMDTGTPSVAEEINKVLAAEGCRTFIPCQKGREHAAEEMRLRLEGEEGPNGKIIPGIKFFTNCYHAIRTLPELTQDKRNPEKVDTNGEDHAYDAIAYLLMSRPYSAKRADRKRSPYELDGWNDREDSGKNSAWGI